MIVLVECKDDTVKKAYIRDKIFMEIDEQNQRKKNGVIRSSNLKNVLWLEKGKMKKFPLEDWLKLSSKTQMWGTN